MEKEELLNKKLEDINITINPIKDYINQSVTYLQKSLGLEQQDAYNLLKNVIKEYKYKSNPVLKYRCKNEHGDMVIKEDKITDYLKDIRASNEIIVPSFTTYMHPDKFKSIHSEFMQSNVNKRSKYKKEAFRLKQEGKIDLSNYNNTMQKTMKIFNNSLSGAYSSKSTVLRNPSAHYTLTSITRCLSSIGNSVCESFISGNKHFRTSDSVYNYITTILTNINRARVSYCIDKYKLTIPTVDNIMDNIKECSKYYWKNNNDMLEIQEYVNKLDEIDRVAVMYVNDFWNLKNLNEKLIREFIKVSSFKHNDPIESASKVLINIPEDIFILTKIICADDTKGINIDINKLDNTELGYNLASTSLNLIKQFNYINYLFHTFYLTNILPIDIAYIKDMMRDCIVLSDTDSTCATYDKWVEWYTGKMDMSQLGISVSAIVMTLTGRVIDNSLKVLGKCMNIPNDRIGLLKMKNEFYWPVFTPANKNKHYFANTMIQEGNVFKECELEMKGVHLIASSSNQYYANKIHNMIIEINEVLSKGKKISLLKYIKYVADLERDILNKIDTGDINIFKKDKIKEVKSYKSNDIGMTPYIHHIMWNDVFSSKYGYPGEPPYMVVKIPTTLDTKTRTLNYVSSIKDEDIKNKLLAYMAKYKKEALGTFRPAITVIGSKGIPEEIIGCINKKRIVMDNLNSAYIALESLGYFKKSNMLISELGY